ncbi:hypothetical protein CSO01_15530 [Cellulomonas soli]|uniref:Uncharacterized protein n=1 Tax=Cellulomonas soli TaxID=931535 RepID=A0A512PCB9_9CELL|nr:hypothetical protein CSO01_15530 [Cellulomonas soli]
MANDADELELADALLAELPPEQLTTPVVVARARLLLLRGRAQEAVAELARHGVDDVPSEGPRSWPELVLTAARAGAGDGYAFQRLLEAATTHAGDPQAWRIAYLVAASAEQLGRLDVADSAWRVLAAQHGIVTPLTVSRLAIGEISHRDRFHPESAVAVVTTQARNLTRLAPAPQEDPGPTLAAVAGLRARGDEAGARLLLHAVDRLCPATPAITEALRSSAPTEGVRAHRLKLAGALLLGLLLLPLGIFGIALVWGGRTLWERSVRLPGLTLTDSAAWRAIGTVPADAGSADPTRTEREQGAGWYGLAIILGAVAWMVVGTPLSATAGRWFGGDADTIVFVLGLVSLPALLVVATRSLRLRLLRRRARRRTERAERARLAEAALCRCWQTRGLRGDFAAAYATNHLVPVPVPALLESLRQRVGFWVHLRRCPVIGVLWLGGTPDGGGAVHLRGAVPSTPGPAATSPGGFYL